MMRNISFLKVRFLIVVAVVLLPVIGKANSDANKPQLTFYQEAEARYAAYNYLKSMDNGEYGSLWKRTSPKAQEGLNEGTWKRTLSGMRQIYGTYQGRVEKGAGVSGQLVSSEKGVFYGAIFQSRFSSQAAEEKIILSLEGNEWKLAGYYIKPDSAK
ncbi:MAG TPA: DUF4019 domain-containing protein [Burkholderiales bacterium]|nr:DUF4019 domain-containing protein [Burkholderiales bacterium]